MLSMKLKKLFIALIASVSLGITNITFAGGSHDDSHGHEEFDPVDNEFGSYEPKMEVTRTIKIKMSDDMRFTPDNIVVKQGDVIKFVHKNKGKIMHEFVLGTPASLDEHAEMMKKFPNMEHSEPYMLHVAPGKKGQITWKFDKPGTVTFGCLIPGHYDAGMKGTITVES